MLSQSFGLEVKNENKGRPIENRHIKDVVEFLEKIEINTNRVVLTSYAPKGCNRLKGKSVDLKVLKPLSFMDNELHPGDRISFCDEKISLIDPAYDRTFKIGNLTCINQIEFHEGNFCTCKVASESEYEGLRLIAGSRLMILNKDLLLYSPNKDYEDVKLGFKFEAKKAYNIAKNSKPIVNGDDDSRLPRCE